MALMQLLAMIWAIARMGVASVSTASLGPVSVLAYFFQPCLKHLPIRALSKEDGLISYCLTPNSFYLIVATSTEKVETYTVLFWLDELAQSMPEFSVLGFC